MKKVLFLFLSILLFGCAEDEGTPIWRIWYAVQVTPNYDLDIQYFSDKYHDTGKLEKQSVHDSSYVQQLAGYWVGQHLQSDRESGYYINVDIKGLNEFQGKLGVFVYVNDTNLIDSVFYSFGETKVVLQGDIPKVF